MTVPLSLLYSFPRCRGRAPARQLLDFEAGLLEMCYAGGRAAAIEEAHGMLRLIEIVQEAYQPPLLAALQRLHEAARGAAAARHHATRDALRTRHPEVLGLPEKLIADGAVPCSTVLEASWLYAAAVDECRKLPSRPTAAAKLGCLVEATKKLAAATAGRTSELSADDLVPLTAMLLVAAALPSLDFEAYVLSELLADALATGPEAYCVCTMQVAAGFLAEVVVV